MEPKTNEYITLYDLRGPWAEESAKKIILQRINTKIDTIIKEKDKEREEAVAEAYKRGYIDGELAYTKKLANAIIRLS